MEQKSVNINRLIFCKAKHFLYVIDYELTLSEMAAILIFDDEELHMGNPAVRRIRSLAAIQICEKSNS